jgi:hypothetical protein
MIGRRRLAIALLAGCAAFTAGCGEPEQRVDINVEYGRQRGRAHGDSLNGTAVIASMFSQAGHRVSARTALSPAIEAADVIVWFPDDFNPPPPEVRRWFEDWLRSGYGRTLVYVGRDYDAEPLYWQKAIAKAPPQRRQEMRERLDAARVRVAAARLASEFVPAPANHPDDGWFRLTRTAKRIPTETTAASIDIRSSLRGDWSEAIDASLSEIELNDVLTVGYDDEPLLYTDDSAIAAWVSQPQFGDGQLLVVQNGSFLLNLALVNHEHRRLAAELIDAVESQSGSNSDVVFLESNPGGPPVHERDPQVQPPTEADYPPPISDMLYHAIALAIVVTLGSWPIFGRPRRLAPPPLSDFGQHVESLGDLLRRSRDDGYCRERVARWTERERE